MNNNNFVSVQYHKSFEMDVGEEMQSNMIIVQASIAVHPVENM